MCHTHLTAYVAYILGTSLIIKIFLFQFVNTNAALVYIAVIKPLWFEIYGLGKGERIHHLQFWK